MILPLRISEKEGEERRRKDEEDLAKRRSDEMTSMMTNDLRQ